MILAHFWLCALALDIPHVPGVEFDHAGAESLRYIGSPSIVKIRFWMYFGSTETAGVPS